MGYLISAGVITFQLVIFVTIVGAALKGRGALIAVAVGWTAFTLFGSIFTAGLLLLQLATIAVAYLVADRRFRPARVRARASSSDSNTSSVGWILTAIMVVAGIAVGQFFGGKSADADIRRVRELRAAREAAQQPIVPAEPLPAARERTAEEKAQDEEAKRRYLENTPELAR